MSLKTILIIDDEQAFLLAYELLLKRSGYKVLTATTGEEGLIIAKDAMPDLILLDVMMPGIGGLGALKLMKSFPSLKHIPIILMSGARPLVRQSDYKWAAFLGKPFETDALLQAIKENIRD